MLRRPGLTNAVKVAVGLSSIATGALIASNNASCEHNISLESPAFVAMRPTTGFTRIDNSEETKKAGEVLMKKSSAGRNMMHHTLRGDGMIEAYEIYVNEAKDEMIAVVQVFAFS